MTLVIKQRGPGHGLGPMWQLVDSEASIAYNLTLNKNHRCEQSPPVEFSMMYVHGDDTQHKATLNVNHEGTLILQSPDNRLFHIEARGTEITITDAALGFASVSEMFSLEMTLVHAEYKQLIDGLHWPEVKALAKADLSTMSGMVGVLFVYPNTHTGYFIRTRYPNGNSVRFPVQVTSMLTIPSGNKDLHAYIIHVADLEHLQTSMEHVFPHLA